MGDKPTIRLRLVLLALLTAGATVGVPSYAGAAGPPPRVRDATIRLGGPATGELAAALDRAVALPFRANLVAVSLPLGASSARIELRAHTARGWDAWQALSIESDEAPDGVEASGAVARAVTEPLWVGTADRLRVRVSGAPAADARLHLVNSKGDADEPGLLVRAARALGRFLTARPAAAAPSRPWIITRAGWGANESWRTNGAPRYATAVQMAFVHHTAGTNSYSRSDSPALVRAIYRYHRFTRRWSDIGYNFLVDRYGQIFEGRFGGMTLPLIGAHTLGFNTGSVGVSLMGTFGSVSPPSAMRRSLERLLAWRLDAAHVPPVGKVLMTSAGSDKYDAGERVWFNRVSGHRDGQLTACPGAKTYALLPQFRSAADAIGHPKLYLPSIDHGVLRPDGDGNSDTITVRATFSRTVSWTVSFTDAAGTTHRNFFGSGTSASATWDGTYVSGAQVPTGLYTWRIAGRNGTGVATPAQGPLAVVMSHPAGTLLWDAQGGKYVLEAAPDGTLQSRAVSTDAYRTTFEPAPAVTAGPLERGRYVLGVPLPLRDGSLLETLEADGTTRRHIFSGGVRRTFSVDPVDTFSALGYDAAALVRVSSGTLALLSPGPDITDTSAHPIGSVVEAPLPDGSMGHWVLALRPDGVTVRQAIGGLALGTIYRPDEPVAATAADLSLPEDAAAPILPRAGTLLGLPDGTRWIVSGGTRRLFGDPLMFSAMGYSASAVVPVTAEDVAAIPVGVPII